MKVWDIGFIRLVSIRVNKYKIDWNSAPSKEQKIIQDFLFPYWKNKIVLKEMRIPSSLLRVDLVCCNSRICIEYSPTTHHGKFNKFFHKSRSGYGASLERDKEKYDWINDPRNNLKYIELNENDLPYLSAEYIEKNFGINII